MNPPQYIRQDYLPVLENIRDNVEALLRLRSADQLLLRELKADHKSYLQQTSVIGMHENSELFQTMMARVEQIEACQTEVGEVWCALMASFAELRQLRMMEEDELA